MQAKKLLSLLLIGVSMILLMPITAFAAVTAVTQATYSPTIQTPNMSVLGLDLNDNLTTDQSVTCSAAAQSFGATVCYAASGHLTLDSGFDATDLNQAEIIRGSQEDNFTSTNAVNIVLTGTNLINDYNSAQVTISGFGGISGNVSTSSIAEDTGGGGGGQQQPPEEFLLKEVYTKTVNGNQAGIAIVFSPNISTASAENTSNYTLVDRQTGATSNPNYVSYSSGEVQLTFASDPEIGLASGDILKVSGIQKDGSQDTIQTGYYLIPDYSDLTVTASFNNGGKTEVKLDFSKDIEFSTKDRYQNQMSAYLMDNPNTEYIYPSSFTDVDSDTLIANFSQQLNETHHYDFGGLIFHQGELPGNWPNDTEGNPLTANDIVAFIPHAHFDIDNINDTWDPTDNSDSNATTLNITTNYQSHGLHQLSDSDSADWFQVSLTANENYTFESKKSEASGDLRLEIYEPSLPTNQLVETAAGIHFRQTFAPLSTGTYLLKVSCITPGPNCGGYTLDYKHNVPEQGGEGVPEFSDYVYIATLMIAAYFFYKKYPHIQNYA